MRRLDLTNHRRHRPNIRSDRRKKHRRPPGKHQLGSRSERHHSHHHRHLSAELPLLGRRQHLSPHPKNHLGWTSRHHPNLNIRDDPRSKCHTHPGIGRHSNRLANHHSRLRQCQTTVKIGRGRCRWYQHNHRRQNRGNRTVVRCCWYRLHSDNHHVCQSNRHCHRHRLHCDLHIHHCLHRSLTWK